MFVTNVGFRIHRTVVTLSFFPIVGIFHLISMLFFRFVIYLLSICFFMIHIDWLSIYQDFDVSLPQLVGEIRTAICGTTGELLTERTTVIFPFFALN